MTQTAAAATTAAAAAATAAADAAQYAQIIDALLLDESLFLDVDPLVADEVHGALQLLIQGDDTTAESDGRINQAAAADVSTSSRHASDHTDGDSEDAITTANSNRKRVSDAVAAVTAKICSGACTQPRKVRKTTYLARKEEKVELLSEVEALQQQLRTLEGERGAEAAALAESQLDNALLLDSLRGQQLSLATSQCVVSGLLGGEHTNPLSIICIRLGSDWGERRKTLLGMKNRVIAHACEYIGSRSRFLDPLKRHVTEERFENAGGDYCCARYDVRQFTNVSSVKQVYDAFHTYVLNVEIIATERLGTVTTRDDFDSVENSIATYRFLTTEFGVPVEKHGVLFMQYFESHELANGGPCGVFVIDRVEEDELYPYMPEKHMRKDVSGIIVLTPHWRSRADGSEGQELVVTMSTGKFIKLHRSEYPLASLEVLENMRENLSGGWGDMAVPTMRDILYRGPR